MSQDRPFIAGIDMDGVMGDYIAEFRRHVAAELGVDPSTLPTPRVWDFQEAGWGIRDTDHFKELHSIAVRRGLFRSMPAFTGLSEQLWRLSDAGVHIRVITHRLVVNHLHSLSASDTIEWLDQNEVPYRDLCFVGLKAQVDAHVYVDDAPHNVIALKDAGKDVLVFDALYNREIVCPETGSDYSNVPRVTNWVETADAILMRKAAWDAVA